MILGARTIRRGQRCMIGVGMTEVSAGAFDHRRAGRREPVVGKRRRRIGGSDAGSPQCFARQVQTPDRRVIIEVAQDVGELQCPAQVMGQLPSLRRRHAEDFHAQPSDGARNAIAIEVERREVRSADIRDDIHFHAVDDGEQVLPVKSVPRDRSRRDCATGLKGRHDTLLRLRLSSISALPGARRADHAGRRCRPRSGRTSRCRRSLHAADAAESASPRRTCFPLPAGRHLAPLVRLPSCEPFSLERPCWSRMARRAVRRVRPPAMARMPTPAAPAAVRCTRSLSGSRRESFSVSTCANWWITEISRLIRRSVTRVASGFASLRSHAHPIA